MCDHQQIHVLESTPALGRVLTELYGEFGHRPVPFSVLSGLPAPPFSLTGDGGGGTLVSGPSPSVSALLEGGPACYHQHQGPGPACRQPTEGTHPCLLSGPEGMAFGEGSSPTHPLSEIGSPLRRPIYHQEGYQSLRPPSPAPALPQGTPRLSHVAGQASSRQRLFSACPHTATTPDPREWRLGLGGQPDPCGPPPRTGVSLPHGLGGEWTAGPLMGPSVLLCKPEPAG